MTPTFATKSFVFRFADVTVREREFAIVSAGQVQQVEPKAFRVLLMLLRNPNNLITKEELLSGVWGDTAVTENSLARNIALLRRLLGDDPREPRFIETVSGIGYRFLCPVEVSEEPLGNLDLTRSDDLRTANGWKAQPANGHAGSSTDVPLPQSSANAATVRREALVGSSISAAMWVLIAGAVLIGVAALALWLNGSRHRHSLTDKDSIVLADFTNTTGDRVFDGTLRQGLAVQLTQSPFLNLVSEQQIQRTLLLMGQAPGARLTFDVARQLCQRIAAAAVVEGSIASLGSEYVLDLKAVSCQSGDALAEEQVQAARKEDVLMGLSRASAQLREKLGESLSTVERFDAPLDQATTPSFEALQAYTLGRRALILHSDCIAAIPLFQRAIDLDPNFAMAYLSLGLCHMNQGERGLGSDGIRKAFELREHTSDWEKFAIESRYYYGVVGNLAKAREIYRLWALIYPREAIPLSVLGQEVDPQLGRYDDALVDNRGALTLRPWDSNYYEGLVVAYINLDRLGNARATADEANKKNLESIDLHSHLYHLAFLQKDEGEMASQIAWSVGKEGVEDLLLSYQADTAAFRGQIEKARELSRRAVASAKQAGEKETAAGYQAEWATREALFGNQAEARKLASDALVLSTSRDVEARAAFALALAGAPANRLADDLAQRYPEDTMIQFVFLPLIRAQLALNRRDPAQAIKELDTSAPYEMGKQSPLEIFPFALYPVYVRGKAFLAGDNGKQAVVEFQRIVDRPALVLNEPIGALAVLGLARSYVLQQQPDKARASYREFMSGWHEADARNPIFQQASSEYRRLGGVK
ncbi:MAG: winged helix-turn-helix domain-containing protein [Acidobacteriaceae bacterium]|jgi:DNA-binding winged helix-turn-helix (wHTH) protein